MAKHSSQGSPDDKSKTIANFTSNLKEHVTKYENHESSCDKCDDSSGGETQNPRKTLEQDDDANTGK